MTQCWYVDGNARVAAGSWQLCVATGKQTVGAGWQGFCPCWQTFCSHNNTLLSCAPLLPPLLSQHTHTHTTPDLGDIERVDKEVAYKEQALAYHLAQVKESHNV